MEIDLDPKLCFVLIPFEQPFEEIYEEIVRPIAEELGLKCLYAEEIFGARLVMDDIWDHLERARVAVADLTGRNANVFYEVGYAHCLDKGKVILMTQDIDDVPFDLRGFRCVEYGLGPRGLKKLRSKLNATMEAVLAEEPESPRVVTRTVEVPAALDDRALAALDLYEAFESLEGDSRVEFAARLYWPGLLEAVKRKSPHVAAVLRDCKVSAVVEGTLMLEGRSPFHKEKLEEERTRTLVEDELERLVGTHLTIECVLVA